MKTESVKSIKVLSRTLELTKRVMPKNVNKRNVSINETEKSAVSIYDTVNLKVFDSEKNLIGSCTYTGAQFHSQLVQKEKRTKYGYIIKFYTLRY